MAHMLGGQMLVLVYHTGRWQVMAEGGLVLVESGGNHVASVGSGLGHSCTSRPRRMRLNGGVLGARTMLVKKQRKTAAAETGGG
jgi:hypothetical protein